MEKFIKFFGQKAKVKCDNNCNKAWGINSRPKIQLNSDDEDDFVWLSDAELGIAPVDPGTYEGEDAKPTKDSEKLNKWCIRECERCSMSAPGEWRKPIELTDWSNRVYN